MECGLRVGADGIGVASEPGALQQESGGGHDDDEQDHGGGDAGDAAAVKPSVVGDCERLVCVHDIGDAAEDAHGAEGHDEGRELQLRDQHSVGESADRAGEDADESAGDHRQEADMDIAARGDAGPGAAGEKQHRPRADHAAHGEHGSDREVDAAGDDDVSLKPLLKKK